MEDVTFEDLLGKDESGTMHKNNIHTLLTGIYKSGHYISPPILEDVFDLKANQHDLLSNH